LPTSAWDTNYVAVTSYAKSGVLIGKTSIDVVARDDDTHVTIKPSVDIEGSPDVLPSPAGQPTTYTLSRGEYVQLSQFADLTGSILQSDKPVGLFGGSTCMNIPITASAADTGQQQIPPVRALGHEYVAVRYRARVPPPMEPPQSEEEVPWRLVGAVDGTTLAYEPSTPDGAPTTLARGQLVEFWNPGQFVVRSQDRDHPFYMSAHMTGGGYFASPRTQQLFQYEGQGDPESINVVPADQYLDRYVFVTDPTYPETNLVIVRAPDKSGAFADVTLDCLGTVSGFVPLGGYEYARVDLQTGKFQDVGGCSNGLHVMKSARPFGLTVWGWGSNVTGTNIATDPTYSQYVSYAYPAGMSVRAVNQVVVPPR
jgi:hypothetical protein